MSFKISTIIPVYNTEAFLNRCLESVINQSLKEIEIIVVNDGSTDDSLKIIQKYQALDKRIKIINQENFGSGKARNRGIAIASGEYINFVDSDDYIELDMYEHMYKKAMDDDSDIVVARYKRVNEFGQTINESQILENYTKEKIFKGLLSYSIASVSCNAIYKTELFQNKECLYPAKKMYNEDNATIYKLYYFANSVSFMDAAYYNWYFTPNSKTNSITKKHLTDMCEVLDGIKEFLKKYNIYKKYEQQFLEMVFSSILKKSYQITMFEKDKSKQISMMQYLLDIVYENNYINYQKISKIKNNRATLYHQVLEIILKLSIQHQILTLFYRDDIDKIKSTLNKELGLLQFIIDYIDKHQIKDIYIYGAGEILKKIFPFLIKRGINIIGIIDNNVKSIELPTKKYKVDTLANTMIEPNSYILISSISFSDEIGQNIEDYSKTNRLNLHIIKC